MAGLVALLCGLGVLYWYAKGKNPNDVVEREPVRPVPSAPRVNELSRPAGSAAPIPNLLAPPSSASPTPTIAPSAPPPRGSTKVPAKPLSPDDQRRSAPPVTAKQQTAPSSDNSDMLDDLAPQASAKTKAPVRQVPSKASKGGSDLGYDPTNVTPVSTAPKK